MELKGLLRELDFSNKAHIQSIDMDGLLKMMLEHIGSPDAELRDQLIYTTFGNLIMRDFLSTRQIEMILESCLHTLYYQIGETNSDSVFTRSFSSLVVTLVLEKDREKLFLPKETSEKVIEHSMKYLNMELDTRGYVDEKGWAHSIAHGADLLTASVKHPNFALASASQCLDSIHTCLFKDAAYVDDEDERLIFAIEALLEKKVEEAVLSNWLLKIARTLEELLQKEGFSTVYYKKRRNVMNFLKSLYFRLTYKDVGQPFGELIIRILRQCHKEIYER